MRSRLAPPGRHARGSVGSDKSRLEGALPPSERDTGVELLQNFAESPPARDLGAFGAPGSVSFIVAMIAAGVALRRAGAPQSVAVLLGFSGVLITAHPPPFGPTGLALFVIAVIILVRSRSAAPAPVAQPRPA